MIILHIANLSNKKADGVNVVVPQHIYYQSEYADVALLNMTNIDYVGLKIKYFKNDCKTNNFFEKIEQPFNKPDLVVFHGIYFINYVKIYKYLIKCNIPYIIVPHGSLVKNAIKIHAFKKIVAHILIFNKFIKSAQAIQFLSKGERNNSIFAKNGIIIPNGINILPIISDNKKERNNIIINFIGRKNIKIKGLDLLIKAVSLIYDKLKASRAEIYLYGPDKNNSNKYINKKISNYNLKDIIFNEEPIYDDIKQNIFLNSDIFIHTSRTEGLPTAVLEAMSYKIPVFVTNGTGLYEDIAEYKCGWVCDIKVKSIAEQLLIMLSQKDNFIKFGENAYNYVKESYDWKKIAKESINIYRNVLYNKYRDKI